MGCQTIMLIVYSVLTPSVCLHVYSYKLQANSRFPSSCPSSFSSRSHSLPLFSLARDYAEREREREREGLSVMPSKRFVVGERDENYVSLKTRHGGLRRGSYLSG